MAEPWGSSGGDFDFKEEQVHTQRDIDYVGLTAQEGALKTAAADCYIPVPPELKELLLKKKRPAGEYVFSTGDGKPLSQVTFKRLWCRLMRAADCVGRVVKPGTSRENDLLKNIKPIITPHYFGNNYVTMFYEAWVDPLIAMKIVGHTDYQTTANTYTHVRDEMLKKSTVNMSDVFRKREG